MKITITLSDNEAELFRETVAYDAYLNLSNRARMAERGEKPELPPMPAIEAQLETILAKFDNPKFSRDTREVLAADAIMGGIKQRILDLAREAVEGR